MIRRRLRTSSEVRAAAVALARYAVDADGAGRRSSGDPVHETITEGRRLQYERAMAAGAAWARRMPAGYSSCGDLAHWLLLMLGVRDERLVNRSDDEGELPWIPGVNLARIQSHPAYVRAVVGARPGLGDVLYVRSPDHVSVLLEWGTHDVVTADYGQPWAKLRTLPLQTAGGLVRIGARRLVGWLDVTRVERVESALLPEGCEVGAADDSPYSDGVTG